MPIIVGSDAHFFVHFASTFATFMGGRDIKREDLKMIGGERMITA